MRDFDPAVMGGFLRDRKLIYVGDSLNGDMAVSMICMMGGRREAKHIRAIRSNNLISEECKFAKTVAAIERACNKTAIREDWREKLAKQRVNEHDVMILNTGAHWYVARAAIDHVAGLERFHAGTAGFKKQKS